ncbi:hypothetical protein BD626DRAFT_494567 [Schizophyllum amplum]|uniref:RING-type domain-containing protein n=1 Tax=Schizophyllum amplum TaxID=97359 RepID=A0A550CFE7_9AGAR|nr:hypothetical protein BD626DRAFT_494567 [Auriculariopsis ampla]
MRKPVIDIESSPEPEILHLRTTRGSAKPSTPIEILDSDDDIDAPQQPLARRQKRRRQQQPLRGAAVQGSSGNVAGPSNKGKARATTPLFLSGEEENEPPESPPRAFPAVALPATHSPSPTPEPDHAPPPPDPAELKNAYVAQVLDIIPDVQPEHVHALAEQYYAQYKEQTLETILHVLFEDKNYPKVDRKGKRKRTEADEEAERRGKKAKETDFLSIDRPLPQGPHYYELALEQLQLDFPYTPKPHIRARLKASRDLYAPTYFVLADEAKSARPPYTRKQVPYRTKGKTTLRVDDDFELEREFVLRKLQEADTQKDAALAEQLVEQEYEDSGDGIECGCCFTAYPFYKMVQCPDAHLFCKDCMLSYAESKLGSHDVKIACMDQSGCKELFPESELRRLLPDKLMDLYDRVKQRKEIEQAGLDGLEECPFCDYKCVIDNPDEKLFRCGNFEDCGAVSCRNCKKQDHLPRTCQEVDDDKILDSQHLVEEAMSDAMVRKCPNPACQKPFIKDDGCNKIYCTNCRTLSCYICRKMINGYEHFNQAAPGAPSTSNKCLLWDGPVERRHAEEVGAAAKRALEEYKKKNPDAREEDLKIDVPKAPPVQPPRYPPGVPQHHHMLPALHHHMLGVPQPQLLPAPAAAAGPVHQAFQYGGQLPLPIGPFMQPAPGVVPWVNPYRAPAPAPARVRRRR